MSADGVGVDVATLASTTSSFQGVIFEKSSNTFLNVLNDDVSHKNVENVLSDVSDAQTTPARVDKQATKNGNILIFFWNFVRASLHRFNERAVWPDWSIS